MFYGPTVGASAARITHTLHHYQLCDILTVINEHKRIFWRKKERERDRKLYIIFLRFLTK